LKVEIEIASNGIIVTDKHDVTVFMSKEAALGYIAEMLPDFEVEQAEETLRLRRKSMAGTSLYDQYTKEAMRLPVRLQDVMRCFDDFISMAACTGISERAIRHWLHYDMDRKPSQKTLTKADRWLRNPTFVGEVSDD